MRRGFWDGGMDWVPKGTDSESEWESDSGCGGEGDMGGLYHSWVCLSALCVSGFVCLFGLLALFVCLSVAFALALVLLCVSASACLRFLTGALHRGRHGLF